MSIKTGYIPKILGMLYAFAGFCCILNSFIMFLSRGFANPFFPHVLFPAFYWRIVSMPLAFDYGDKRA